MARDDFTQLTKRALAERAGFRCSYPGCSSVTIGPSDEREKSTSNTGEAAHIAAASAGRGARRYDPNMTPNQRSSIDNGIWCCNTHAKLIDTDEATYSVQMLQQWKVLAERRAQLWQAYGNDIDAHLSDLVAVGLAPDKVAIQDDPEISEKVGSAVQFSWLVDICGKDVAHVLRDFLIEHCRNAFSHGGATKVNIDFHLNSIEIIDDGAEFHVAQLHSGQSRGGGKALSVLRQIKALGHVSSHRNGNGTNAVHIPFVLGPLGLPDVNPCAIALSREAVRGNSLDVARFVSCDRVYVVAPNFVCYSDGPMFKKALWEMVNEHPNVVLILPEASEQVVAHFRELFPSTVVETW